MQLQVFSLIKEKRATFLCQISSEHEHPAVMGISVLLWFLHITRGPFRKWCHLTSTPSTRNSCCPPQGWRVPPSSHAGLSSCTPLKHPKLSGKLKMDLKLLAADFNTETLSHLQELLCHVWGLGCHKSQQNSGLSWRDKELYQRRLLMKFWKKLNQHNPH